MIFCVNIVNTGSIDETHREGVWREGWYARPRHFLDTKACDVLLNFDDSDRDSESVKVVKDVKPRLRHSSVLVRAVLGVYMPLFSLCYFDVIHYSRRLISRPITCPPKIFPFSASNAVIPFNLSIA